MWVDLGRRRRAGSSRCSWQDPGAGEVPLGDEDDARARAATTRWSWVPPFFILTVTVAPTSSSPSAVRRDDPLVPLRPAGRV